MGERYRPHYRKRNDPGFRYAKIAIYVTTIALSAGLLLLDGLHHPSVPASVPGETPIPTSTSVLEPSPYSSRSHMQIINGIFIDDRDGGYFRSRVVLVASK